MDIDKVVFSDADLAFWHSYFTNIDKKKYTASEIYDIMMRGQDEKKKT